MAIIPHRSTSSVIPWTTAILVLLVLFVASNVLASLPRHMSTQEPSTITQRHALEWQWKAHHKMMKQGIDGSTSSGSGGASTDFIHLRNGRIGSQQALHISRSSLLQSTLQHHDAIFSDSNGMKQEDKTYPFLVKWNPERTVLHSRFLATLKSELHITVHQYLPHHAHLIYATLDQIEKLMQTRGDQVDFITQYDPLFRVSGELLEESSITTIGEHTKRMRQENGYEMNELSGSSDRILIAVNVETQDSEGLAREIAQTLKADVRAVSSRKLLIIVDNADKTRARDLSMRVAHHRQVVYVEQMNNHIAQSENKFSRGVMQSSKAAKHPYTDVLKLSGKGQVIGYGDSGIDVYNCFMYDTENAVPFYDHYTNETLKESKHRKFAGYYSFIDDVDDQGGHGTHVGGTLAGKMAFDKHSDYNGMAPDAKLAFVDVGCTKEGGCKCADFPLEQRMCPCLSYADQTCPADGRALYLPLDLYEGYFPFTYELGARIFSNSIGGRIGESYSLTSHEIDRFMWDHPDFLIIWSAGNSGRESGFMTLTGGMKQYKNGLVVGAGAAAKESWLEILSKFRNYDDKAKALQSSLSASYRCDCGGSCYNKECEAVAKLTTHESCCEFMNITRTGDDEYDIHCNTMLPNAPLSDYITNVVSACCQKCGQKELLGKKPNAITEMSLDSQSLASFSSLGPAIDGRIKPDIVAPGFYVLSASSHASDPEMKCTEERSKDDLFNVKDMAGTSMAAPTASGTASIVRSYFTDGHYPAEDNAEPELTSPSAALVKAAMITAARPMTGVARLSDRFSAYTLAQRRFFEGFGLINLLNVLKIKGENDLTPFTLFAVDNNQLETNTEHRWVIEVPKDNKVDEDITVTLVWTDFPGAPAASYALVNDLDLKVTTTIEGQVHTYYGNALDESMQQKQFDRLNTVEKITISKPVAGARYTISVHGFNVPHGPQPYALIATGPGFSRSQTQKSFSTVDHDPKNFLDKEIVMRTWVFILLLVALALSVTAAVASVAAVVVVLVRNKVKSGNEDDDMHSVNTERASLLE